MAGTTRLELATSAVTDRLGFGNAHSEVIIDSTENSGVRAACIFLTHKRP